MKSLLKNARWFSILGAAGLVYHQQEQLAQALFSKQPGSDGDEKTKTYIWGNGLYISGGSMTFSNFEPKLIKNFDGENGPMMK